MSKRHATLDDVARVAGMSRAQVSRALRGDPGVKEATRERIAAIAAQLEYRPNLAARSLVSERSSIVGLAIGDPNNPFHIQLAQAVDHELAEYGFDPVVSLRALTDESALSEADRLLRLRAAGVILIATPHQPAAIAEVGAKLHCVYIGNKRVPRSSVSIIAVDDEGGVRQAMEHLLALGHRRIGHVAGGLEASAHERTRAYLRIMKAAGLEPVVAAGAHDAESGRRGVDALMALPDPPTAIFASNDFIAIGVMDRLKGMGLRVPTDVSVIGFDDVPSAANSLMSLTTVHQDVREQARMAVQMLRDRIEGKSPLQRRMVAPVRLVIRHSVDAPSLSARPASVVMPPSLAS